MRSLFRPATSSLVLCLLALLSASPSFGAEVVINEIMYNSLTGVGGQDVEFIELINNSDLPVNLAGWYLLDSDPTHPRCYLTGTLPANEILVVAADLLLFSLQFPSVTNVNPNAFNPGGTGFGLGNAGDTVKLFNLSSALEDSVAYVDSGDWPSSADGNGPSLELINPNLDNNLPTSWDPSDDDWGTPGTQNSAYSPDADPICRDGARNVPLPLAYESVFITVTSFDPEGPVTVDLFFDPGMGVFQSTPMVDDGLHGDGAAGDSIFGAALPGAADGTLVRYYCEAIDGVGQDDSWPNGAPTEYAAYTVGHQSPALRITEVLASNLSGPMDETGTREDWLEICNQGDAAVNLAGMYLSDDPLDSNMWPLPAHALAPGEYILIWADNDTGDGPLHSNFKLSSSGEWVGLYGGDLVGNSLIDGLAFGPLGDDMSAGYLEPDGNAPEYLAFPTPGADNVNSGPRSMVCINEFHTTSSGGGVDDWVELYNRGGDAVDIGGWMISDDSLVPAKYVFPPGTQMASGSFLLLDEVQLGFGFDSDGGDVIFLAASDSVTGLDYFEVGIQIPDRSMGRSPDGAGNWDFLANPTPAAPNTQSVAVPGMPVTPTLAYQGAWPNPFNPSTSIRLALDRSSVVRIAIHGVDGRAVRQLHDGALSAGTHEFSWDGRNDGGRALASGLYLVRIQSEKELEFGKLMLVK